MVRGTPRRASIEDNPYVAVRAAVEEARRLNKAFRSLGGSGCPNPVNLAIERLHAGLLHYVPEDPSADDKTRLQVVSQGQEMLLRESNGSGNLVLQQPRQDEPGNQVGNQVSNDLGERHAPGDGHQDEAGALVRDGRDDPHSESEPETAAPTTTPDRYADTPVHVGK